MKFPHDIAHAGEHAVVGMTRSHPRTRMSPALVAHARALAEHSPLPMLVADGEPYLVHYANPAFVRLVGPTPPTLRGGPLVERVYATGEAAFVADVRDLCTTARHELPLPCLVWPILGEDDRPAGLLVQLTSPPETPPRESGMSAAEELVDANRQLVVASLRAQEQAELELLLRNEAEAALGMRDEFMSIAAHELRTPVTGIKTSAQLGLRALEDDPPNLERTARYLLGVVHGSNRLIVLINDLMDVSRMRSGELLLRVTSVDLTALVPAVAVRYAETVGEHHHLTVDTPGLPLLVAGDTARLEQVLDNLLSNAVKYSPAGGDISVVLRRAELGAELTVIDTGIGLPPGAHERIFEAFGRAPNARRQGLPGMGLGLHICRRIAEAHGGRMWAESAGEGQGMSVGMWLPAA